LFPESEIGKQIRLLRKSKGLTLEELALRSGFSKGYLSKVENSDKAPPVSTLVTIAEVLQVSISEIFGEPQDRISFSLVRKGERESVAKDGIEFGYSYDTLAHNFPHKHMAPYVLTIPTGINPFPFFQHKGEEIFLVLEGCVRFVHGDREVVLEEGDCIYFDASLPHRGYAHEVDQAKCLIVVYTPLSE
jgi:transcriptional regulator with XRE-family HTH domain